MNDSKIFSAVNTMIKTDRMHRQMLDGYVSRIGIHRTQHRILMHIERNNRIVSQKSLAEYIGITPAAVTGAIKKLECEGYIRRAHGSDGRYYELELTDLGKRIVEETKKQFSELDTSLFEDFTDEELDGYTTYLEKIQKNIKKHLTDAELRSEHKK